MEDNCSPRDEEEEDWMFKTFKGKNNKKEERTARINEPHRADGRARITEIEEEEQEFGDNPFDMAPEMTK